MAGESDFLSDDWCGGCGAHIRDARATGVSGLHLPGAKSILLCGPCFLNEDDAVLEAGTNDLPERVERYRRTIAEAEARPPARPDPREGGA